MTPFAFFLALAVVLICVEILVLQFSVFWVFFFGLGALVAALYAWLLPSPGWIDSTAVFVLASLAVTAAMIKPLRRWQTSKGAMAGNDAIGQEVEIEKAVAFDEPGTVIWSGTDWKARLDQAGDPLQPGQRAVISRVQGLTLYIRRG